jgi:hypothetical protein
MKKQNLMVMAIVFVFGLFLANYAIMAADAPEKVDLSPYKVSKKESAMNTKCITIIKSSLKHAIIKRKKAKNK